MALLDVQVGVLANQAMNYLVSGAPPRRLGNAHPNIVPYQVFAAADGNLIIAVGNDGQFRKLVGVLGVPEIADDARLRHQRVRVANRAPLIPALSALIAKFQRADLLERLERAGVPAGPINSVAQVFADPQVIDRGMRFNLPRPEGTNVPTVRTPILMSETHLVYGRASPRLGEHSSDVLAEIGYAPDEIERLVAGKVVGRFPASNWNAAQQYRRKKGAPVGL